MKIIPVDPQPTQHVFDGEDVWRFHACHPSDGRQHTLFWYAGHEPDERILEFCPHPIGTPFDGKTVTGVRCKRAGDVTEAEMQSMDRMGHLTLSVQPLDSYVWLYETTPNPEGTPECASN